MDRRVLGIVTAAGAAALSALVAVYTWATAAALGAGSLNARFVLSVLPLVAAPLVGAELLRRHRPELAGAVLATAAVAFLPVPASALLLLTGGGSRMWTASALLELAAYSALVVAAVVAVQLVASWPARRAPRPVGAVLAVAVVAGAVWPPVTLGESGVTDLLRPVALRVSAPGDAAVLVLMALVIGLVLWFGLTTTGRVGALIVATTAALLFTDHLGNLVGVATDPAVAMAPAGWAGLLGSVGLLVLAFGVWRGDDRDPGPAWVTDPDPA